MGCCDSKQNNLDQQLKYQYRKRMKLKNNNISQAGDNHNDLETYVSHNQTAKFDEDLIVFTMIKSRA